MGRRLHLLLDGIWESKARQTSNISLFNWTGNSISRPDTQPNKKKEQKVNTPFSIDVCILWLSAIFGGEPSQSIRCLCT